MTQQVRWFAGAAHAAGVAEEVLDDGAVPEGATVAGFLAGHRPQTAEVLQRCSFLADGKGIDRDAAWPVEAGVVDVLPPFTGG